MTEETDISTISHALAPGSEGLDCSRKEVVASPPLGERKLLSQLIMSHKNVAVKLNNLIVKNTAVGKMEARNGDAA